jgi:glycerol-3-phosphate acyltransferase PlsY
MDGLVVVFAIVIGYLAGSISFARIVTRLAAPEVDLNDLRIQIKGTDQTEEVGIMGANAASMVLGPKLGLTVAFLDMAKVVVPLLFFRLLYPGQPYHLFVAIAGLVGHNWPIYYRFRGGRGFAVIFGSFLVIDWVGSLATTVGGLAFGMMILGNPMIAYISWLWLMIPWMVWRAGPWEVFYALAMNIIFIFATIPEMRIMIRMRREGKYRAYTEGLYNSSPRWRGMNKMAEKLWLLRPFFRKQS